ncbi:MAG: hypothetical protein OHK93_002448 [Ramalina farinacea]|uniref:Uncharacterized protein n=1 Tax=Ramalina farinacea TaxID=258253 RepID=A0AA43QVU6_9LECA|nr:hypothetical protein [Ramalina farinacea]
MFVKQEPEEEQPEEEDLEGLLEQALNNNRFPNDELAATSLGLSKEREAHESNVRNGDKHIEKLQSQIKNLGADRNQLKDQLNELRAAAQANHTDAATQTDAVTVQLPTEVDNISDQSTMLTDNKTLLKKLFKNWTSKKKKCLLRHIDPERIKLGSQGRLRVEHEPIL